MRLFSPVYGFQVRYSGRVGTYMTHSNNLMWAFFWLSMGFSADITTGREKAKGLSGRVLTKSFGICGIWHFDAEIAEIATFLAFPNLSLFASFAFSTGAQRKAKAVWFFPSSFLWFKNAATCSGFLLHSHSQSSVALSLSLSLSLFLLSLSVFISSRHTHSLCEPHHTTTCTCRWIHVLCWHPLLWPWLPESESHLGPENTSAAMCCCLQPMLESLCSRTDRYGIPPTHRNSKLPTNLTLKHHHAYRTSQTGTWTWWYE